MLNGFSGQVVFERWTIGLYNLVSDIFCFFSAVVSVWCEIGGSCVELQQQLGTGVQQAKMCSEMMRMIR